MTSLSISRKVDRLDPEAIRDLVASGRRRGLIRQAPATTPQKSAASPLDTAAIRQTVAAAVECGALTFPPSPAHPARIARNGQDVLDVAGPLRSQWMDVTPATAAHWLKNNFVNRIISDDTVTAYARDMAHGVWVPTHQGVAFNDLDHLIDGQHRLLAIIKCGLTIRMMVTFGLPSKIPGSEMTTMDAVDRGRTRSVADQLKIQHGLKHGSTIAAICAALGYLCCNERTRRLSVGQTLDIYRAFQPAIDWIVENKPKDHGLKQTGVLAAFVFAITAADTPAARAMFSATMTGTGIIPGGPLAHLRAFLTSDDAKLLTRGTARGVAEIVLNAMFLWDKKTKVHQLEISQDGYNHYRSLQPQRVAAISQMFAITQ